MSILTGKQIELEIKSGAIEIDPYDPELINPASVDLRLGDRYLQYIPKQLDARRKNETIDYLFPGDGVRLEPGKLYLMHTVERIRTDRFVTVIDGKSSVGRLGIVCHLTAGYGDLGYNGQYTLEVTAVQPVVVYAGMRFCQARFHPIVGEVTNYQDAGNYVGAASMGPVASRSWKQF